MLTWDKGSIAGADGGGVAWGRLALRAAARVVLVAGLDGPSTLWTSLSCSASFSRSLPFLLVPVLVRANLVAGGRLANVVEGCGVVDEVGLVVAKPGDE
jgi:hypothetical protein